MRHLTAILGGVLVSAAAFTSCTCHKEVSAPPTLQEPPSGFHAAQATQAKPTRQMRAMASTPSAPAEGTPREQPAGVPADFPKDVPIYKDATVSQVQDLANNAHNVIFSSSAPIADVFSFYQGSMTKDGWKVTQQFQRSDHAFATFQKGDMVTNLTVAPDIHNPGKQLIVIMYEEQKPLEFEDF